jgi:hypothetical protein
MITLYFFSPDSCILVLDSYLEQDWHGCKNAACISVNSECEMQKTYEVFKRHSPQRGL